MVLQKEKDSSCTSGRAHSKQPSSLVGGLLCRNWWAEVRSAVGRLGGSRLAGCGLAGGWAGGFGLCGLAGIVL